MIVVQRNLFTQRVWDACEYWRGLGKTVVADLDDAYQMMPVNNPAYWFWVANRGNLPHDPVEGLKEGLRHVDALLAPSKVILEDWADVVTGLWLPNFAEGRWYKDLPERDNGDKVIIGYGCSVSHYDSWWGTGIREAAVKISEKYPQVVWRIHGNDPRIHGQLQTENKERVTGVSPEEWPKHVAQFDIGVAPLQGEYDQRRSWLKAAEYILAGVPWVATEGRPYEDLAEHGTLVENTVDAWVEGLSDMIDNLEEKQAQADRGANLTIEENMNFTSDVFKKAMALHKAGRLPGVHYVNWE